MKRKIKQNSKILWFFRSLTFSLVIFFCAIALLLGFLEGYARMESKITGENIKVLERRNHRIYILNKDVASAEFLEYLEKFY